MDIWLSAGVKCVPCARSLPSLAAIWASLCHSLVSCCRACAGTGSHSISSFIKSLARLYALHFHGKKSLRSLRLCSWRLDLSLSTFLSQTRTARWKHSCAVCWEHFHALKAVNYSSAILCLVKCMVITLGGRGAVLCFLLSECYWSLCSFKSVAESL